MTEHLLYTFRRCPYAIRARMALAYAGINCELRELLLRDKPADMLMHSPKATVPVLITATGQVIDESIDVMRWALEQNDPDEWLNEAAESKQLIAINDQDFKPMLDRYKYADRHPELTESQHRDLTLPYIEHLNLKLLKHKFLINDQISLADVAIFPFVRQHAFVNKPWFDQLPYPKLQQWLRYFLASDVFNDIMPKFKLFNDGFRYQFPAGQPI